MRIAVTGKTMTYLSGQPMYCYEVARELRRRGHEVDMISTFGDNEIRWGLEEVGVRCLLLPEGIYDVAFLSEFDYGVQAIIRVNIVHSEYDCETPIPNCDGYVAIRPSIKEHIIKEHDIPEKKIQVIYNGVDLTRFKPVKKPERDYKLMVAPCTLDPLREKFLNVLISLANKDKQLILLGDYHGARLIKSPYVEILPSRFDIEKEIQLADEVHGILLGRVNLEAYACGVDSYMWNPDTLFCEKFEPRNFKENHNIVNVVGKLLKFAKSL